MARLINLQLIETDEKRGSGVEEDPMRRVMQLFAPDGTLVLEYDPHKDAVSMTANLLEHIKWIPKL